MKLNRWMMAAGAALALATLTRAAVYVDQAATGANDGTSWADAYTNLTDALSAGGVDEIWVAQGHYVPGMDRTQAFALKADTAVYGGFTNGMTSRTLRDWTRYPSILSGDIGAPGDPADNSHHVVIGATNATLDGFVVTGGCNTNVTTVGWNQEGAGFYASNCSLAIINCVFSNNAARRGGGLFLATGQASLDGCRIEANTAIDAGGGLHAYQWGGNILNSSFNKNGKPARGDRKSVV